VVILQDHLCDLHVMIYIQECKLMVGPHAIGRGGVHI
jgi:hypothetical protein